SSSLSSGKASRRVQPAATSKSMARTSDQRRYSSKGCPLAKGDAVISGIRVCVLLFVVLQRLRHVLLQRGTACTCARVCAQKLWWCLSASFGFHTLPERY